MVATLPACCFDSPANPSCFSQFQRSQRRIPARFSFMQNQAPRYFHLHDLRSLYWVILPFHHRLIQRMISTRSRCVRIDPVIYNLYIIAPTVFLHSMDLYGRTIGYGIIYNSIKSSGRTAPPHKGQPLHSRYTAVIQPLQSRYTGIVRTLYRRYRCGGGWGWRAGGG
eukprot:COSAG02_NODE_3794_length_6218_cov_8.112273_2_plen_167_part_00